MITPSGKNSMLDHLASLMTHYSLHSAFPGNTGASEISGGSPAYARRAASWNSASGGALDNSDTDVFDIPASTTVRWWGSWSALSGGTFYAYAPLGGSPKEFIVDVTANTIECPAHGFANGDRIVFYGDTVPGGLVEGTEYFVVGSTTDDFQVAGTSGGSAIDLTSQAGRGCLVSRIVPETFAAQGTYTLNDADIDANN